MYTKFQTIWHSTKNVLSLNIGANMQLNDREQIVVNKYESP